MVKTTTSLPFFNSGFKVLRLAVSGTELSLFLNPGIVLNTSVGLRKENDQESALGIVGYINQS